MPILVFQIMEVQYLDIGGLHCKALCDWNFIKSVSVVLGKQFCKLKVSALIELLEILGNLTGANFIG